MKKSIKIILILLLITSLFLITSCKDKYTVTFIDYNGTVLKEELLKEGEDASPPVDPTREGYTFTGWSEEFTNIQKDTFIIAQYEQIINKYTVKFVDYNGTILKEEIIEGNKSATAPADPTREGYTFIGWNTDYTNITSNLIITAQYEQIINKYKVTFKTNCETTIEEEYYEKGNKIKEPTNLKKLGYTFLGWYLNEEKWIFIGYVITDNMTLEAKWEPVKYNISYELNGGIANNPITYTIEDNITLNNPTKENYTFVGWTTPENNIPNLNVNISNETQDKTFIANYQANTYNITYELNGGIANNPTTYTIEDNIILNNPTKEGYNFFGWTTPENNEPFLNISIENETENKHFIATWTNLDFNLKENKKYEVIGMTNSFDTQIIIPEYYDHKKITSIAASAFKDCYSLTSIVIPNSVTSIGNSAFECCDRLTIYCESTSKPSGWDSSWNSSNRPVYFGVNENNFVEIDNLQYILDLENNSAIVSRYAGIEETVEILSTITHNNIEYSVTSIGNSAFSHCYRLTSIVIPNSVTSIGNSAFYYCYSLTSIVIQNSVISIGNSAFTSCDSLTIYCESTSKPSGWDSNWNSSNRPVYFGANENNFVEIDNLQYILDLENNTAIVSRYTGIEETVEILLTIKHNNIEYSVTSIGNSAFKGCGSLTSIVIPNSVTSIGNYAFYSCLNLRSIVIPNSVTSIGNYAFSYCVSLRSIVIPNSVTSIGNSAFYYCIRLTSIVIPNSVISIGFSAFSVCSSLTIYCESTSKPSGWDSNWNPSNRPVVFGYTIEE